MSEPRSLPLRPDLRRLRDEAKRRRAAGEFRSIARAQLAIAREYGFRSWPRLKFHVEALTLDAPARAAALIASVTSADLRRARALLDADPGLARHDLACACATGEAADVSRRVAAHPAAASDPTGPYGCAAIRSARPGSARSHGSCSPPAQIPTPSTSTPTSGSKSRCTARPESRAIP